MSLTNKQKKSYIEEKGTSCPFCGCGEISADLTDAFSGGPHEVISTVTCDNEECGKQWVETYTLTDIQEVDHE